MSKISQQKSCRETEHQISCQRTQKQRKKLKGETKRKEKYWHLGKMLCCNWVWWTEKDERKRKVEKVGKNVLEILN